MLSLRHAHYAVGTPVNITDQPQTVGISKLQAKIFHDFFGLRQVAVAENANHSALADLLIKAIRGFMAKSSLRPADISKVVYAHTSLTQTPFGHGVLKRVLTQSGLANAVSFGINLNKCASAIEALKPIQQLIESHDNVLLLSADVAFTPQQRYLHNASIAGDAAGAVLLTQNSSKSRHLEILSTHKQVFPEFYKGAWLDKEDSKAFELRFPSMMASTIEASLEKAGIPLAQVKFILPHNVNLPIWKQIAHVLDYPVERLFTENIPRYGHCFSTDFLINLTDIQNQLNDGDIVVAASVGFGLSFVSAVFKTHGGSQS